MVDLRVLEMVWYLKYVKKKKVNQSTLGQLSSVCAGLDVHDYLLL